MGLPAIAARSMPKPSAPKVRAETLSRSHLINARTSRKRQHLRSETVETQPNHHFPPVAPAQVLWFFCNRAIYEISSSQLRVNKSAACRRAIQRILAVVKKKFEDGKYKHHVEAEADFRQLVDRDESCTG